MRAPCTWSAVVPSLALLMLALGARPVQAQGSVSVTPYAGIYVPTKNSFSSVGNDIKRKNSFFGGGRLTFWGKSPLGVEFTGGFAPAKVEVAGGTINASRNTNVFAGGVKLMLGISPAVAPIGIYVGGGPAIIRRGADLLNGNQSQTDFGGLIGAGIRLPLGQSFGVRFDAEDYLYDGDFSGSNSFQNDLVLTAGLSLVF
jgi:Outer membrane protein beta-barrel domain